MRSARRFTWILAWLGLGCLTTEQPDDAQLAQAAAETLARSPIVVIDNGETLLDCRDEALAGTHVLFECDSVTLYACAPLARATLEYEDGARQRFTRLRGQIETLAARGAHDGKRITSVRVELAPDRRAGAGRASGAAELFEAPDDSCGPPPPETGKVTPAGVRERGRVRLLG